MTRNGQAKVRIKLKSARCSFTDKELDDIERYGELGMQSKHIAALLGTTEDNIERQMRDPRTGFARSYFKGLATGQFRLRALMYDAAVNPNSKVSKEQRGMLSKTCDLILIQEKELEKAAPDLSMLDDMPVDKQAKLLKILKNVDNKKRKKPNRKTDGTAQPDRGTTNGNSEDNQTGGQGLSGDDTAGCGVSVDTQSL